jgi:hypothetical protein
MQKVCKKCSGPFEITLEDEVFLKKFEVPAPSLCPECRNQRRWTFRNDRNFYKRDCDLCHAVMISIYSKEKPFPVYCKDCYLSDAFDPLKYGVDYDPTRSFFEQFGEMRARVPRMASYQTQSENSDYTVHSAKNRNCYMGNSFRECEDVFYSDFAQFSKDSMDLYMCSNVEQCYDCTDSDQCYHSIHLENCMSTNFSCLCFDCRSSSNLIACVGLRRKEFMVLNKPVSKEEFEQTWTRFNTDPTFRKDLEEKYKQLRLETPVKSFWEKNSENCSGNYIVNSKNAQHCYNSRSVEDSRYNFDVIDVKDAMDITRAAGGEFLYEVHAMIDLFFSKFCNLCYQSSELEYCDNCQASKKSFGCMSLKGHSNCILNKHYSPEDYEKLRDQIKAQMLADSEYGEFFPSSLSVFAYNESKARDFFPLTREQALAQGYQWRDPEEAARPVQGAQVSADILACEGCGKNYRIIPQELAFYRKMGLPLPHFCFDCRHLKRVALQNPQRLYSRACAKCSAPFETTYAPDRPEKVYCEKCYLETVG